LRGPRIMVTFPGGVERVRAGARYQLSLKADGGWRRKGGGGWALEWRSGSGGRLRVYEQTGRRERVSGEVVNKGGGALW
jgi:hypothetical protein